MAKIFYFLGHEQYQPEVLVQHAKLAERAGFEGLLVSEHFNPWVADQGSAGFAFSTLGAIAQVTSKVELMTGVVTPLFRYHPAIVAQAAATIDRLSSARFSLGIGTGETINEVPLGYSYPSYKERAQRLEEAIEIIQKLLLGEQISVKGNYYKTKAVKLYSPPLHKVPIYVAAGGPKTATLAAKKADGVIVSVKDVEDALQKVINPAKVKNQNIKIVASRWSVYAKNSNEAFEALKAWRGLRASSRNTVTDPLILQNEADKLSQKEILDRYSFVSSAKGFLNAYRPLIEVLHADVIVIQTTALNQKALIRFLGKEVVPNLKKL